MKKLFAIFMTITVIVSTLLVVITTASATTETLYGDANADGAVNMKDVLTMRKYIADMPTEIDLVLADANGDGVVNMKDVLLLRKYLANLIDEIPGGAQTEPTESDVEIPTDKAVTSAIVDANGDLVLVLDDGSTVNVGAVDALMQKGEKGDKGDKGETGAQGPQGEKGETGETGAQGPRGEKGETGETGAQGPQGEKGETGETGAQGPQGIGIASVEKTATNDNVDTYTITLTNGSTYTFTVTNGKTNDDGTDGLAYYPLPDGTYGVKAGMTQYLKEVEIPSSHNGKAVTQILPSAFAESASLETVIIPETVTTICERAFENCTNLKTVNLPDLLVSIEEYAFYNCSQMNTGKLPNLLVSIGRYAFYDCSQMNPERLPDLLVSIGEYAFYGCSSWNVDLVIPPKVTTIREKSFGGCKALKSVTIPKTVTKIGSCPFSSLSRTTPIVWEDMTSEWEGVGAASTGHYSYENGSWTYYSRAGTDNLPEGTTCVFAPFCNSERIWAALTKIYIPISDVSNVGEEKLVMSFYNKSGKYIYKKETTDN